MKKNKRQEWFKMFGNCIDAFECFDPANVGIGFMAALHYFMYRQKPEQLENEANAVYHIIKRYVDSSISEYEEVCEKNRSNVEKRWKKPNTTEYDGIRPYTTVYNGVRQDTEEEVEVEAEAEKEVDKEADRKHVPVSKKVLKGMEAYADVCHSIRTDQRGRMQKHDEYQQHHYTEDDFGSDFYYNPERDFLPETKVSDNGIDDPHCPKREESKQENHEAYYDEESKSVMVYDEDIGDYISHSIL